MKARRGWFCVFPLLVSFLQIMRMEEDTTGPVAFLIFQAARESRQAPLPGGLHETGNASISVPLCFPHRRHGVNPRAVYKRIELW
jgi:hypothetical protein